MRAKLPYGELVETEEDTLRELRAWKRWLRHGHNRIFVLSSEISPSDVSLFQKLIAPAKIVRAEEDNLQGQETTAAKFP